MAGKLFTEKQGGHYYINNVCTELPHAGYKAVIDCYNILEQIGYEAYKIDSYIKFMGNYKRVPKLWMLKILKCFLIPHESIVVIGYPYIVHSIYYTIIRIAKHIKKFKCIYLVHDLDSARFDSEGRLKSERIKSDKIIMDTADAVIIHNEQMGKYCIDKYNIVEKKLVALELFDYLPMKKAPKLRGRSLCNNGIYTLVVAGNLTSSKAGYLYQLIDTLCEDIHLNLYGSGFDTDKCIRTISDRRNYTLKGTFPPEELIEVLEGSFGLVWDGDSISECQGMIGQYLKINNPHKVSLYIICEMPIIIWSKAALAEFVTKNKIGIAIDSLEQLGSMLKKVTEEEYSEYCRNIKRIARKARDGGFLKDAIIKAEYILDKQGN